MNNVSKNSKMISNAVRFFETAAIMHSRELVLSRKRVHYIPDAVHCRMRDQNKFERVYMNLLDTSLQLSNLQSCV